MSAHSPRKAAFSVERRRRTSIPLRLTKNSFSTSARQHDSSAGSSPGLTASTRSSGEFLPFSDSGESDVALSPATDLRSITSDDETHAEVDLTKTNNQHASTKLVTQDPQALQDVIGDGETGTRLIQKYCCGGGCCFLNGPPPVPASAFFTPIEEPDNAAYRSLNLKLMALNKDTELTNTAPYPETKLAFERPAVPLQHTSTAQVHPPNFVQPHPPYAVFSAPVFHARELTKPGAEKRTFHFDIDVTDYPEEGDVDFKVGGAIGVCPPNSPEAVNEIFELLGVPTFIRDKPVVLRTSHGRWPTIWGADEPRSLTTTRRELLMWCVDIQSYPPSKPLLRLLAEHATAVNEKKILMYLASAQGQGTFCDLRTGDHLSLVQILNAFPSSKPPLHELLGVLDQLMPRFYSLSNDPHVSSDREGLAGRRLIEIAVSVHETPDFRGDQRTGVGSGYLERVALEYCKAEKAHLADPQANPMPELRVPMFRGLMANPLSKQFGESNGPMMLIGAGVGMAPFRGFILNRLKNANCANKIWLVQGVRDSQVDELYSGELGTYEKQIKKVVQSRAHLKNQLRPHKNQFSEGDLPAHVREAAAKAITDAPPMARSESQFNAHTEQSRYVQDELRQQADIVWDVVNAIDGRIFVCGSSKGMGEGVEQALRDVIKDKINTDEEGARAFWTKMKDESKLIMEVW